MPEGVEFADWIRTRADKVAPNGEGITAWTQVIGGDIERVYSGTWVDGVLKEGVEYDEEGLREIYSGFWNDRRQRHGLGQEFAPVEFTAEEENMRLCDRP